MRTLAVLSIIGVLIVLPFGVAGSQEPETTEEAGVTVEAAEIVPGEPSTPRELLESIRDDLIQLRFEKALAALEPLLLRSGLSDDERIEAWVLRSQTHAAFGDLGAAEEDYTQILLRRPSWSPDPNLTPRKAMDRYGKVRDKLIGKVRFVLDPADSTLVIDGAEVPDALLPIAMLAGTHELQVARRGHDPVEQTVDVEAGESVDLEISLIPNARTVILRTEPDDVEVWLDDVLVGRTQRTETFGSDAAELVIEDVPIGEHRFEFRKECRRTERFADALNVDLLDRAPKRYDTVRLPESNVLITPEGGPTGTKLRVDGVEVATLPVDVVQACPGQRVIEALYEGRLLWSETLELTEALPLTLAIRARPNLVLIGMDRLPRELAVLDSQVNVSVSDRSASGDLAQAATWDRLRFSRDTDLVLARADADVRQGVSSAWWLYSPVLRTLETLVDPPDAVEPSWTTSVWGLVVADDGNPLIVERLAGTEKPAVGSRLTSLGGQDVPSASAVVAALAAAAADGSISASWLAADGSTVEGSIGASQSPWLVEHPPAGIADMFRAAWAVVASESDGSHAASALANLALLFGAHGEHEFALRTWRRVTWPDRAGIGAGTVAYYTGRALQALGRDREAVDALRRAAQSAGTAVSDEGPPVAPAARDRLADLGESP